MNAAIERPGGALKSVDAHRRRDVGGAGEVFGAGERHPQQRRGRLRAVDQCQAFLGAKRDGFKPCASQRVRPRHPTRPTRPTRLTLPNEHQCEMRERRQVAARAHRPARRHARVHAAIQHLDQQLQRFDADAGKPFRQHVGAQRHCRAHHRHLKRVADAGGVAAQQIDLKRVELIGRNLYFREIAEARIDAVRRLVAVRVVVDHFTRGTHARARGVGQSDLFVVMCDRDELIQRQGRTV